MPSIISVKQMKKGQRSEKVDVMSIVVSGEDSRTQGEINKILKEAKKSTEKGFPSMAGNFFT